MLNCRVCGANATPIPLIHIKWTKKMKIKALFLCVFLLLTACNSDDNNQTMTANQPATDTSTTSNTNTTANSTESLAEVINQYRVEQGLPAIPISVSLTLVAEAHVADLAHNNPVGGQCNLHSWSNQGNWTACCYTSDHAQAHCMWDKPREITDGLYQGNGYEISAHNSGRMTAQGALAQWQDSAAHHDVILNRGIWFDNDWQAIGAAVSDHFAVVWFGTQPDPAGSP